MTSPHRPTSICRTSRSSRPSGLGPAPRLQPPNLSTKEPRMNHKVHQPERRVPLPAPPKHLHDFTFQPDPAVMATVDSGGRPLSLQIVYLDEDAEHILLSIATGNSRCGRLQHLREDPHVSLTVSRNDGWTEAVNVLGTAVEFFGAKDLETIDAATTHCLSTPYAVRNPRTAVRVRVDEWTEHSNAVFQAEKAGEGETVG
ncbi:pyridoxamine 5'-phosphate oxidase family protein [Arthrobacter sp. HS15c]|uniref:pyridoxamine 5'-phosphate oxidase family protein n=1 Tax=Arthrobacter sp. HS15c TaxID=3230279 RepID=UPI003465A2FE